jgi:prepilin-type N-terminal cleavage/methylation domain-containing protein
MRRVLSNESGFGLIELLIAMMIMAIGISAIVAGFSSGIIALDRASRTSTAGTLADRQMEAYRALQYTDLNINDALVTALQAAPAGVYKSDLAYTGAPDYPTYGAKDTVTAGATCSAAFNGASWTPVPCMPSQSPVKGPDGRNYRVDSFIVYYCPISGTPTGTPPTTCSSGSARPVKQITVVVRDCTNPTASPPCSPAKTLFRETSTFDSAT